MVPENASTPSQRRRVLWLSTVAFTLLFAVWLMLGVLGIPIRQELGLSKDQFYWLGVAAILSGSLLRFHFGVWSDRYGGRLVITLLLLLTAIPTYWVSRVTSYAELMACALLYGLAGNSFAVGIAWNAAWFPKDRQGTALGIFGAGNVGASVTKLIGPAMIALVPAAGLFGGLAPGGWRFIPVLYAVLLVLMAAAVWLVAPAPDRTPARGVPFRQVIAPLRHGRVWQYSLHYVVVFGAYVALSLQLPTYYVDVYGTDLATAGLLTALYIFPASLLRPLGGYLSDRFGAKGIMYAIFAAMLLSGIILSIPGLHLGVWAFTAWVFVLGCGMGVGKAAVYKLIPDAFPRAVGAVGGLVGLLGALGGVFLPLAWAALDRATGVPQTTFLAVLALTVVSSAWFHVDTVRAAAAVEIPVLAAEPATN
jgi:NNP family nitrate/nitrite transporter-like MFS transporter